MTIDPMKEIEGLVAFEGRWPGTDAERRAAQHLERRLQALGRDAEVEPASVYPNYAVTHAIHALIAPRPHLELSGDQDGGAPTDGIVALEKKLGAVYRLYGKGENFRSVIYQGTGHEYLPEMKEEMAAWFERHLPVQQ